MITGVVKASELRCPDCGRGTWAAAVVLAPQPSIAVGVGEQIPGRCPTCGQVNRDALTATDREAARQRAAEAPPFSEGQTARLRRLLQDEQ